jgi:hypothetical protein
VNEDKVEYVFDQHRNQPRTVPMDFEGDCDQAIAEARAAEREACCKDMCWMCATNETLFISHFVYKHAVKGELNALDCNANPIRQRWAAKGL